MSSHHVSLAAALLLIPSCRDVTPTPATAPSLNDMRPGDSLLDRLAHAVIERYPESNLPPELHQVAERASVTVVCPIERSAWIQSLPVPEPYRSALGSDRGIDSFRFEFPRLAKSDTLPRPLIDGHPVSPWEPEVGPFPGSVVWYDPEVAAVRAVAPTAPDDVAIEYESAPATELGRYECGLTGSGPGDAHTLVVREEIFGVSRPALLLPASGTIAFDFTSFPGDVLSLAVAVADRGYQLVDGRLWRGRSASDGVDFAVQITVGGRTETVWSRTLPAGEIGRGFIDDQVDLARYRGREVELRLVTGPGAAGNPWFDNALWSDLRLLASPQRAPAHPNVVLIDIDTLRADRMSIYGYARPTTPQLERWTSGQATVYRDAVAASSWTLPSTASILTGLDVHQHGLVDREHRLTPATPTLAMRLRALGYETYAMTGSGYFCPPYGFDLGFDLHDTRADYGSVEQRFLEALERLRDRRSERPVFLFLHTYAVHAPWRADARFVDPAYAGPLAGRDVDYLSVLQPHLDGDLPLSDPDKRYVAALYDAAIARLDTTLGRVLDRIDEVLGDDTMVIVTADHGEELWDHGKVHHGQSLYRELLRVPLVVRYPRRNGVRRTGADDGPASLVDLVPTVLDELGIAPSADLPGHDLRQLPPDRIRVAMLGDDMRAIQIGRHKLILNGSPGSAAPHLFDLDVDPGERVDGAAADPATVARLRRELLSYFEAHSAPPEIPAEGAPDERSIEALRTLGYVR